MNQNFVQRLLLCLILMLCMCRFSFALNGNDTIPRYKLIQISKNIFKDSISIPVVSDTGNIKEVLPVILPFDSILKQVIQSQLASVKAIKPTAAVHVQKPKVAIGLGEGYISYLSTYRGYLDTPFAEKDIFQQNITGQLGITVAETLPLQLRVWSRTSNSKVFRDIFDVQLLFDANGFSSRLKEKTRSMAQQQLDSIASGLDDPYYKAKVLLLENRKNWLEFPVIKDYLVQCNELLNVDRISFDPSLSDSLNTVQADSLKKKARIFMDTYAKVQQEYDSLILKVDSLTRQKERMKQRIASIQNGLRRGEAAARDSLKAMGGKLDDKLQFLSGIQQLGFGKIPVYHSELTAKNISVNGVNLVYNRKIFFAFTAGGIDYRFRDFSFQQFQRLPQPFVMGRIGMGNSDKQIIASYFKGKKQLFGGVSTLQSALVQVSGISVEGKYRIHPSTLLTAEFAQSYSPDIQGVDKSKRKLDWKDGTSQAVYLALQSFFPVQRLSVQAYYKKTGARYQSFNSFQTNAAQEAWQVRAEKSFWKNRLRVQAGIRTNEFSNPLVIRHYSTNTVFKSLTVHVRLPKLPVIGLGYQPHSQLVALDSVVYEYSFQSLQASALHSYKVGNTKATTSLVFNRFYEKGADTGSLYYGANNIFLSYQVSFQKLETTVSYTATTGALFDYKVLEEKLALRVGNFIHLGTSVKINNYNKAITKLGYGAFASIYLGKDLLSIGYDRGYLPGYRGGLIRNPMGNIQYTKRFQFQ